MADNERLPQASARERAAWLDILRVLAMLAVMLVHVSAPGWSSLPTDSGAWLAHTFYDSLARLGVPLFFMISGALFLDPAYAFSFKQVLKKNVLRLVTAYLFWSVIYVLCSGYFVPRGGMVSSAVHFVMQVLGGSFHFWFIIALLALYLLLPFLRKIAAERRLLRYFLLLWLIFGICLRSCRELDILGATVSELLDEANLYFVWGYTGYFLLGYYLYSADISRAATRLLGIGALAGLAATCLMTWLSSRGGQNMFWFDYMRPNILLLATGVFAAGKRLLAARSFSERGVRAWAALGKWSFGAYLCHMLVLTGLERWPGLSSMSLNPWLMIPLLTLLIGVISYGISWILNKIPFVNRWLV